VNSADLTWFKSSYSGDAGGQCLDVALDDKAIHVRDSKTEPHPTATLTLSPAAWTAFLGSQTSPS
jgi:hypothetical protein